MNTLDTRKVIAFFDAELDAEYEKAVQWYQEQLNATNWTDFEISLFELMEICCHELESHIRKAEPRPRVREVIVTNSFAERWSKNPDHYRDHYGAEEVEIK